MDLRIPILIPALLIMISGLTGCDRAPPDTVVVVESSPSVESLIETFLAGGGTFRDIPFSDVVMASSGNRVLPVDPNEPVDSEILDAVTRALDNTLEVFNRSDSPILSESRINEVSSYFEEKILELIDATPGFRCGYPRTREGNLQRAGYPDLRIVHEASGRVTYLDPKLVKSGTIDSSLRTFYFTPRGETGKVLDDAHHLLVGFEHDGNTGAWKFLDWYLVDLAYFKVRLKTEFQASNRDLYLPETIIRRKVPEPKN